MIPICLLTGFLGSGKTTLLEYLSAIYKSRRIVYVINEFSSLDVDGPRIRESGIEAISLPGRSIFCKCLVSDFIKTLKEIPAVFGNSGSIDGVIIEASGIADPRVAGVMLKETGLDATYDISTVAAIVDPGSFGKLIKVLPSIRSQILSSDILIINKSDIYHSYVIDQTEKVLRALNQSAQIFKTKYCRIDFDIFQNVSNIKDIKGFYASCNDPDYESVTLPLAQLVDVHTLQNSLRLLGDSIYRAKGYVTEMNGSRYLDYSSSGCTIETVFGKAHSPALAMIVKRGMADKIKKSLESFAVKG